MTTTRYRYHPAYQEGRSAYAEGTRRSHNPYAATGEDQFASSAWWQGYDDEAEINQPDDDGEQLAFDGTAHYDKHMRQMAWRNDDDCTWYDEN